MTKAPPGLPGHSLATPAASVAAPAAQEATASSQAQPPAAASASWNAGNEAIAADSPTAVWLNDGQENVPWDRLPWEDRLRIPAHFDAAEKGILGHSQKNFLKYIRFNIKLFFYLLFFLH